MKRRTRPAWYSADDKRAELARRYGITSAPTERAGMTAWFDGDCSRCGETITRHNDKVTKRGDEWIHARCASGGALDE